MPAPNTTTPVSITPNAIRYESIVFQSSISPAGQLTVTAILTVRRSQKNSDGTWIDDPSPSARQTKVIQDLNAYCTSNPDLAPAIQTAWTDIDTAIGGINTKEKLV
jgi:hypothetical protein